ncbi:hypothetical protein APHAL10511_001547 [Amanita phalloides]|nr:hypothetical protein APHAL10511_001547 [Amanita phalloides]
MHAVCFQYLMTGRCIKRSKCEYLHPFPASTNSSPAKGRSTVIRNLSLSPTSSSPEPSTTSTAVTNCPTPTSDKERRDLKKVGNGLRLPPGKQQVELSGGSYLQLELEVALLELEIERSRNAQMRTKLEKERLSQTKAEEKAKDGEPDKEDAIRAHEDVEESLDHVIVALKEMENRIEETLRKELEAERKEIARENMEAGPKEERALQGTEKAKRSEVEVDQHLGVARRATQEAELSIKSTSGTLVAPDPQEPLFRKANRSFHIWRSVDPGESKPTGGASLAELRATAAMRDYNTTVQRLLWGSTLVTYGAGLKVSSVIYGFDNGFIAIHGLPLDVKEGDIEYLLRDLGTRFCVVDTRQYGDGTISATAIVEGNQKHSVAGRLTGKTVRGRTINANAIEHTRDPAPPYALNIAWEFPTRRSTRSTVSEFYLQEFYVCLRRELESSSGLSSYEFISPTLKGPRNMATVRFRTWSAAKKVHDQLAGKRLRPHFPVIQCSLRPHEPKTKYALRIPLQLRNIHGSKLHRRNIVATGILEANDQTTTVECLSPGWFDGWHWSSDSRTLEFFEYDIVRKDSGISMIKRDWLTKTLTFYATTQAAIDSVLVGEAIYPVAS